MHPNSWARENIGYRTFEITATGSVETGTVDGVDYSSYKVTAATRASDGVAWNGRDNLIDFCKTEGRDWYNNASGCSSLSVGLRKSKFGNSFYYYN